MAVCLPVLLLLILGLMEFGRGLMVQQLITNAAREGARQATLDGASSDRVQKKVHQIVADVLPAAAASVKVAIDVGGKTGVDVASAAPGDVCSVSVSVCFEDVSYFPGTYLAGKRLTGKSSMHHE
jgi:Flp pilus assembly protein TadG